MASQARSIASAAVGALVLLLTAAPARSQVPTRVERVALLAPGTIAGVVQDDKGVPIAGATVSAFGPTRATAMTDRRGRFEMGTLSPGAYLVRARSEGFVTPRGQLVEVRSSARASSSIALHRLDVVSNAPLSPVLAAVGGAGSAAAPDNGGTVETAAPTGGDDTSDDNHSEIAWRIRHARRGVLKEVTITDAFLGDPSPGQGAFNQPARFGRFADSSSHLAPDFHNAPLSGQLNLLTTGSFDTPQQLFSGDSFARGIAYLSLGAAAGDNADWTVRGALTQGDVSSWILAATYATRGAARHQYQSGLSYSTQRHQVGNLATPHDDDVSRNVGELYGFDTFSVTPRVAVTYGARVARYDYLDKPGLVSPRLGLTLSPGDHTRIKASLTSRALAPGAEEFVPPVQSAIWLPPQRTFSSLDGRGLEAERTNQVELALERDVAGATLTTRAFHQQVGEQIATVFGVQMPDAPAQFGHYFVANTGGLQATGWSAGLRTTMAPRVHGSVEYTMSSARWNPSSDAGYLVLLAPSVLRLESERVHDVTATVEAALPETSTRLVVLYRVSNAFSVINERPGLDSRFDIQVRQSLPFMDFGGARWEMLVAVRNLFREATSDSSIYDELLVVHPPKRIVGGLTLHF